MSYKKAFLTGVLLVILSFVYGQKYQIYSYSYHLNLPKVVQKGDFSELISDKAINLNQTGYPQTLFYPFKLLLPPNSTIDTIKIEFQKPVAIRISKKLQPFQGFSPTTNNFLAKKLKINTKIYQRDSLDLRKFTYKIAKFRNFPVVIGSFSPIIYKPRQNKILFFTNIKISIKIKPSTRAKTRFWYSPTLFKYIDNPQMLKNYALEQPTLDYLIITSEKLKNSLDTLKTFYESKGYKVKILTTNLIDKTFSGQDLPEKIRNAIIYYFQNTGITYVLLGGDIDIIPYRGFYCKVRSSQIYQSNDIPADIYYSGLDGTWNNDFDQNWAEPQEADLLLDVAVGRLPFDSPDEAKNMINKILTYQQKPVNQDLNKYLLIGEYLWNDPLTYGAQYLNLLIGRRTDSGYTTQGIPQTAIIDSLYDRDSTWDALTLLHKINKGYNFIFHCGHSNSTHLMRLSIDDITRQNFSNLNGTTHLNPIFYTHGCYAGAFDHSDCITEQMLKLPVATSAVIANSRYGWFNEGQADGPSEHLNREFVNAIFGLNQPNLGIDQLLSKNLTSPFVDLPDEFEFGATRWVYYDCNLLGDPLQQAWTDTLRPWTINFPASVTPNQAFEITFHDSIVVRAAVWQDSSKLLETGFQKSNKIFFPKNLAVNLHDLKIFLSALNRHDTVIYIQIDTPQTAYLSAQLLTHQLFADDTNFIRLMVKNTGFDTAFNINIQSLDHELLRQDNCTINQLLPQQDTIVSLATSVRQSVPDSFRLWLNFLVTYKAATAQQDTQLLRFPVTLHAPVIRIMADSNLFCRFSLTNSSIQPFTIKNSGSAAAKLNLEIAVDSQLIYQDNCQLLPDSTLTPAINIFQSDRPIRTVSLNISQMSNDTIIAQKRTIWLIQHEPDINFSNNDGQNLFEYNGEQWSVNATEFCNFQNTLTSPQINDNDSTAAIMQLICDSTGYFGFSYNVSSQKFHDYFKLYIDGQLKLAESGQSQWKWFVTRFNAGLHSIKFLYTKDSEGYCGRDNVQIDNIFLPQNSTLVSFNQHQSVKVYPNPFSGYLIVTLLSDTSGHATIYDLQGRTVMEQQLSKISFLRTKNLKTGIYILKIRTTHHNFRQKIIKQ